MATITGLTAERMLEIEGSSVVEGEIVGGELILTKHDGTTINAGPLPPGPQGPVGPAGGQIPGEVKLWPGSVLPLLADYGKWVWADGAVYDTPIYPKAAEHIAIEWRTFAGASDPGVNRFRVPDLRGLTPAGLDKMPGPGARANRLTRSVAIVLAGRTGEETHVVTIPEMPPHPHPVNDPTHGHPVTVNGGAFTPLMHAGFVYGAPDVSGYYLGAPVAVNVTAVVGGAATGITVGNNGGGGGHETMQPTVFVPYIVKLDD
jgi:microcystin-dependent protein